jgi:6,7-dimethyl-8-ribityllumazine synthase
VEVPTGGKQAKPVSPRALLVLHEKVSRFGAIPKPTVTVRMKEIGCRDAAKSREFRRSFRLPCFMSRPRREANMDQLKHQDHRPVEGEGFPQRSIAFIQSSWHKEIVNRCRNAFIAAMGEEGIHRNSVDLYEVPGAFEIPLLAKRLAGSGRYRAIVASGFVANGGIYRHEFVAQSVISGLMQVQLETDVPVLSAVLTPHHFHEHEVHHEFFLKHFDVKGREVAAACIAVTRAAYGQPVTH